MVNRVKKNDILKCAGQSSLSSDKCCQFTNEEFLYAPKNKGDKRFYCIFHLSPEHKRELPQNDIDFFNQRVLTIINSTPVWKHNNKNGYDFSYVNFPPDICFKGIIFKHSVVFDHAKFSQAVTFEDATFKNEASFIGTNLYNASFSKAQFNHTTTFDHALFYNDANFRNAKFNPNEGLGVSFEHTQFHGKVDFHDVLFDIKTSFEDATFYKYVDFSRAEFDEYNFFSSAVFKERAEFSNAVFKGHTHFNKSEFIGNAGFHRTSFHEHTSFHKTIFRESVFFTEARFEKEVSFDAHEKDTPGWGVVDFSGTEFNFSASFENRVFLNTPGFIQTTFNKAPNFSGCVIHKGTTFVDTIFNDVSADAYDKYSILKKEMKDLGRKEDYHLFFSLMQACFRNKKENNLLERTISKLYHVFSNYGTDCYKPLAFIWIFFLISLSIFFMFEAFTCVNTAGTSCSALSSLVKSTSFTIQQTLYPPSIWRYDGVIDLDKNSYLYIFGGWKLLILQLFTIFHTLINISLAALFFMGLNWRFKKGGD